MTLELRFERRSGRTHLVHRVCEAPFALGRPFDLGDGVLTVFVQSVAGVIRGGEQWSTVVSSGPDAAARVVHAAALPVHAGSGTSSLASMDLRVHADEGSMLEIISAPLVMLSDADASLVTQASTVGDGAIVVLDAVTHHGGPSSLDQRLVADVDGGQCRDRVRYRWPLDAMALPDGRHASLWWIQLAREQRTDVDAMTRLPNDCGWLGRGLGPDACGHLYERLDAMRFAHQRVAHPQRLIDITRGRGLRGTRPPAR
jgi:hypothetical protein